jgi:hypothetical protein
MLGHELFTETIKYFSDRNFPQEPIEYVGVHSPINLYIKLVDFLKYYLPVLAQQPTESVIQLFIFQ